MDVSSEQLKREKIRAVMIATIELILGATMILIGIQFINVAEFFKFELYEVMKEYPQERYLDLYRTIITGSLAGGFFAMLHGVKRMVDNLLNAWVKSAIPTEQK